MRDSRYSILPPTIHCSIVLAMAWARFAEKPLTNDVTRAHKNALESKMRKGKTQGGEEEEMADWNSHVHPERDRAERRTHASKCRQC